MAGAADHRIGAATNSSMDLIAFFKRRRSQDLMVVIFFSARYGSARWPAVPATRRISAAVDGSKRVPAGFSPAASDMHPHGTGRSYNRQVPAVGQTALLHGFHLPNADFAFLQSSSDPHRGQEVLIFGAGRIEPPGIWQQRQVCGGAIRCAGDRFIAAGDREWPAS